MRINVTARRISGGAAGNAYGVTCRATSGISYYLFAIWSDAVQISKYGDQPPFGYTDLRDGGLTIDPSQENHIAAQCTDNDAHSGVHLVFLLNDHVVVDVTDTDHPLTTGTIGMGIENSATGIDAEFRNYMVTKLPNN